MKIVEWEKLPPKMQTEEVKKYYEILKKKKVSLFFKRVVDVCVAVISLIFLSPLYLVLTIAIKIDSPGPIFYRQERVTQYGKRFYIHKFRTMVQDADKGTQVTLNNDSRITRVGKIIRDCRLDETAQIFDVLQGTVTLVGARPEVPKYVDRYTDEMMATLLLPAGVTSLASIYYRNEAKLLDNAENADEIYVQKILPSKMYYNLKWIERFSFWGDIKIVFMTIFALFGQKFKTDYEEMASKEEIEI